MTVVKPYTPKNKEQVLALLKANTPEFFAPEEQKDLEDYLNNELEDYFVVLENNVIIGSGGINYFPDNKEARISWDIIAPNAQGKGIGKQLMQHRIKHINKNPNIDIIVVRTTQLVYPFYAKMGFELEKVEKDYWAKGFDLYQMIMKNN